MVIEKSEDTGNTGKKGQAMVEFALVVPVLMVMLIGIIEASWMMFFLHQHPCLRANRLAMAPL